jgi:hypothetical protein
MQLPFLCTPPAPPHRRQTGMPLGQKGNCMSRRRRLHPTSAGDARRGKILSALSNKLCALAFSIHPIDLSCVRRKLALPFTRPPRFCSERSNWPPLAQAPTVCPLVSAELNLSGQETIGRQPVGCVNSLLRSIAEGSRSGRDQGRSFKSRCGNQPSASVHEHFAPRTARRRRLKVTAVCLRD